MRDPTAVPPELVNVLRGRRYAMTNVFINKIQYMTRPQINLTCTIHDVHYNADGRLMVGLRWPGGGVLVYLDDITDLVAL